MQCVNIKQTLLICCITQIWMENWLDNMPENLQGSAKADELQEAVDNLESFVSSCEEAENVEVDFPGMF